MYKPTEEIDKIIKEAMGYMNEDYRYAAIIGTIEYGDIDLDKYEKEDTEEQSFDHIYKFNNDSAHEDVYRGEILIPYAEKQYLICEFQS